MFNSRHKYGFPAYTVVATFKSDPSVTEWQFAVDLKGELNFRFLGFF